MRTGDRGDARPCSRASGSPASAPRAARSCAPPRSCSPAAPGRARAEWLPEHARPPVRPVKGQILELRSPAGPRPRSTGSSPPSASTWCRARDGRLIAGATVEERGFDTAVTAGGVHELLREAYRLLPESRRWSWSRRWPALRPGTPDNLPIVGPGALEGLILATGHFRNGILLAPPLAAARVVEALGAGWRREDRAEREALELPDGASLADAVREAGAEPDARRRGVAVAARRRGRAARRVGARPRSPRAAGRGPRGDPGRRPRSRRRMGARRPRVVLAADRGDRRLPLAGADGGGAAAPRAAEIVTVALRRIDPAAKGSVLDVLDKLGLFALPNTAGCFTARDAIAHRAARPRGLSRPTGSSSR